MIIKFIIFIYLFLVVPFWADAAEFRVESDAESFGVGEEFLVTLVVDTAGEAINAFEGKVVFPESLLELQGVREKGSVVSLWVQDPPSFSGLTPGGYNGRGVLFSLVFKVKGEGSGIIDVEQGRALLNDGEGTPADLTISRFEFSIPNEPSISQNPMVETNDTEPPEPFEIRIARDTSVFDGKPFLVFAAQDKNSGIDHYEISFLYKGKTTDWQLAENPFLLEHEEDLEKIWVKAVDRAGNERIATLALGTKSSFLVFLLWGNAGILIGIGIVLIFLLWRKKEKREK
ncbi:MAG TPA: cohesin domain-containing protein [Candidatus Paceibacterota bacterium]|nr:cohesin domain-containing protein [Candidatus Paceibacterota bacterium]